MEGSVRERVQAWRARRWMVGSLMGCLLASPAAARASSDPAAALDQAISAAEGSLQSGDLTAAEGHYREALFEGWLLRATISKLDGRRSEAREALASAATFAGETPEALSSLAASELQLGGAARAVEILTGLVHKTPGDPEVRRLLAKALAASGHLPEAVQQLDEASASAAADPERAFLLATEYLWVKRADKAEGLFVRVVEAHPIPQTHVLIGRAYRDAGEFVRAAAELREALSEDPSVRRAHYYLGMVILADARTGPDRLEKAIAEFRAELKLAPDDAPANDELGTALLEAERPTEALPALESAVKSDPRFLHLYHLGRCQLALERPVDAVASLRRALDLGAEQGASERDLEKIHYQLGLALRKTGAGPEAAAELAEASRLAARGTFASRADMAAASSPPLELSRAARHELEARAIAGLARGYFNLGVLRARNQGAAPSSERFREAAALLAKAAELDPAFPRVQASLGVARFNAGQFAAATDPLTRALGADPSDADLRRMLAMSWLNTKAWDKVTALLADDPERKTDAPLQLAYGLALVRSHRAAEAEAVLAGLLPSEGGSAELRVLLGEAFAAQGKYDAAIGMLRAALAAKPDSAVAHYLLGKILLAQGAAAEARDQLEAAARLSPDDSDVRYELGRAYQTLGEHDRAQQEFTASRQLKAQH
jgi:tetratricopeptide (TPR) repeat protein